MCMSLQHVFEEFRRIALPSCHNLFRRSRCYELSAAASAFRADVDEMVGHLDDIEIMLNDDDGVALVDEPLQNIEEDADVLEVQARRGFVEDKNSAPRITFRKAQWRVSHAGFHRQKAWWKTAQGECTPDPLPAGS